jgi:ribosomal protein S18 acetylase RimI-like enzyme
MKIEILIREARPEDAAGISTVHIKTWQHAYAAIFPVDKLAGLDHNFDAFVERWESILTDAERFSIVHVAEANDGKIIGFVNATKQLKSAFPQDAEITAIYILPEYHRKGIGRRLFTATAEKLQENGFQSLLLWVLAENSSTRAFYEGMGGRFSGEDEYLRWGKSCPLAAYAWDSLEELTRE